jgi:hypothetical protein
MANRVTITNWSDFESAISAQKEIGKERYHNYLESQKKVSNQISKEAIVEYLNERIEERSKSMETYTTKGKYYHLNEASLSAFKSVLFLIEKGVFDEKEYNLAPNGAMFDKSIPFDNFTK